MASFHRLFTTALIGFLCLPCQAQSSKSLPATVRANNQFAFKILKADFNGNAPRNVIASPINFSRGFSLLANGSDVESVSEIRSVLELGNRPLSDINLAQKALSSSMSYPANGLTLGMKLWID